MVSALNLRADTTGPVRLHAVFHLSDSHTRQVGEYVLKLGKYVTCYAI